MNKTPYYRLHNILHASRHDSTGSGTQLFNLKTFKPAKLRTLPWLNQIPQIKILGKFVNGFKSYDCYDTNIQHSEINT